MPSLYERLGGVYAIAAVVDDFIDRIIVDSTKKDIVMPGAYGRPGTLSNRPGSGGDR
jgi:hypothetical protein